MSTTMNRLNVTILDGADQITHWTGTPGVDGGELNPINESPVGGPPVMAFDSTGRDRKPYTFPISTKILGAILVEQESFLARYALGKKFINPNITGLPPGLDWQITKANPKHDASGENPSMLDIVLSEIGPTAGP